MPSPLAHLAVGVAAWLASGRRDRPSLLACLVASVAPDVDLLPAAVLDGGMAWHHGATHSLVGAAALGALCAWPPRAPWAVAAALAHVPMDWSTGNPGEAASFGVPWLWPWSDARAIAAAPWFGSFDIHRDGFVLNALRLDTWRLYAREAAFGAAVVAVAALYRRARLR